MSDSLQKRQLAWLQNPVITVEMPDGTKKNIVAKMIDHPGETSPVVPVEEGVQVTLSALLSGTQVPNEVKDVHYASILVETKGNTSVSSIEKPYTRFDFLKTPAIIKWDGPDDAILRLPREDIESDMIKFFIEEFGLIEIPLQTLHLHWLYFRKTMPVREVDVALSINLQ